MRLLSLSLATLSIFSVNMVHAAEGGYSNYIPGFYGDIALAVAPENGFAIKNDVYFYSADSSKALLADNLLVDLDVEFLFDYVTLFYKPDISMFGAEYAMSATMWFGGPDIKAGFNIANQNISVSDDVAKIADLTIAPLILYWNYEQINISLAQYIVIPTSDYSTDRVANPGLNYWTFETDVTMSYFNPETGQDYSVVFGYNYNTENDDTDYQTGEELHIDLIANQFLSETFAIGIHGFHLQQISKDKGDGARLGSFKARASGLGPALMWVPESFGGEMALTLKLLKEIDVENRLEGEHMFFSIVMSL